MYIPSHFELYELLPKAYYKPNLNLWFLFDDRLLKTIDRIRIKYGKMIINDWIWGGNFQYSCWRPFDCKEGAEFSQHKWGRAVDLKPQEYSAEQIRKDILENPYAREFKFITCIEDFKGMTWVHIDFRNYDKENKGIFIVSL